MKAKYILAVVCGMLLCEALSAQTEEFRFKLYMESLSSGKKDTLELGVGPNGIVGCDYDSTLCTVYTEPFFDTVEHIGAFIVPDLSLAYRYYPFDFGYDTLRVECPVYFKKRIGICKEDITIIVPFSEQPVKVYWDNTLFDNPNLKKPYITTKHPSYRFDVGQGDIWRPVTADLANTSSCMPWYWYGEEGTRNDSLEFLCFVPDSVQKEHPYTYVFIRLCDEILSNNRKEERTPISIYPNPGINYFTWESSVPLRQWRIYSISGKLILSGKGSDTEINCQDWASGIYVFRWESKNHETGFVKIVKE